MRPRAVAGVHQTGRQAPRARRTMKATLSFIATGASTTVGWPAANTRKISSQNPCPTSSTPAKSTVPYRNRSSPVVTRRASDRDSSCTSKPASFTPVFVRSKLSGSGSVHCRNRSASTGTRPTCAMARDTPRRAIAASVDTAPWRRASSTSGWQAVGTMTYFDLFRNK